MIIESDRILLRPLTRDDVSQEYVEWLNDPEVNRFLETRHSLQTQESCIEFVESVNQDPYSHLFGVYARRDALHIGNVKLGFMHPIYKTGQLSLFIGRRDFWGKGYAKEIIQAVTRYGFDDIGLERIEAGCYEKNIGSLRAFLSCGYSVEGFLRKSVLDEIDGRIGIFRLGILKHEYL